MLVTEKWKGDPMLCTFHGRDEDSPVFRRVRGQDGKEATQFLISYKYLKHPELRLELAQMK